MDLASYIQIPDLDSVAEANGIKVPRLRGYRLMAKAEPLSAEEMREIEQSAILNVYEDMCRSLPRFSSLNHVTEYSWRTDRVVKRYIKPDGEFRWELLHGKARKNMKYAVKKKKQAVRMNTAAWNRYAGKENVLYIHARVGGPNWSYFGCESLEKEPWFLEKADDPYDSSYCSVYARIEQNSLS